MKRVAPLVRILTNNYYNPTTVAIESLAIVFKWQKYLKLYKPTNVVKMIKCTQVTIIKS